VFLIPARDYLRAVSNADPATAYGLFTGRFSEPLAQEFAAAVGLAPGQRVLDVGCGPGALTQVLVRRLGVPAVSAVDPSEAYVAAVGARLPGVDVRRASAERLPYPDDTFDVALAQLVVHFMADPVAGLREMARVTRGAGVVAACVWDNAGASGPLSPLWQAAQGLDPAVRDESGAAGARAGHLAELAGEAGLVRVQASRLTVEVPFETFHEWWEPLTLGIGSGGAYVQGLEESRRQVLRERLERAFGPAPFTASASAWCIVAEVPAG
jgi:SAM-dependent methyltransferase